MIADIFNNCLTIAPMLDNLAPLSPHVAVGICSPREGDKKSPIPLSVFLCPLKSNTGLIRVQFFMVDFIREALGFARSFAGTANLIQSTARFFAVTGGGYSPHKGIPTMSQDKSTQKPTPSHKDEPQLISTQSVIEHHDTALAFLICDDSTLAKYSDSELLGFVKVIGDHQDVLNIMASLAEDAMVRIESFMNATKPTAIKKPRT
jgi:hypothetical protein